MLNQDEELSKPTTQETTKVKGSQLSLCVSL